VHAEANEVVIQLSADADEISLSLEDDGKGMEEIQNGIGLENIARRVLIYIWLVFRSVF